MLNSNPVLDFKTFDPKLPYLAKFGPKIENASFFMKIGTQLNLRVLISNPVPNFNNFYCKLPYLVIFSAKTGNAAFSKKIGTQTNLRVQISNPVLDLKNFFLDKLVQELRMLHFL